MRASELIAKLEECIAAKGDLEVFADGYEISYAEIDIDEEYFIAIELNKDGDMP
jgi:hypothetical protein